MVHYDENASNVFFFFCIYIYTCLELGEGVFTSKSSLLTREIVDLRGLLLSLQLLGEKRALGQIGEDGWNGEVFKGVLRNNSFGYVGVIVDVLRAFDSQVSQYF